MESKSNQKLIVNCKKCGEKVMRTQLKQHTKICRQRDPAAIFDCPAHDCAATFKTKQGLRQHIRNLHIEPFKCPFENCDVVMLNKKSLPNHVKRVHEGVKRECTNCGKQISYGNLSTHLKLCTSDGSEIFECPEKGCGKLFKTAVNRSNHIWAVHSPPIKCPDPKCGDLIKRACYKKHVESLHNRLKQQCQNCGKQVAYGGLYQHLKSCTSDGSRPFRCPEQGCDKTFKTSGTRSSHVCRVHNKPIKCSVSNCNAVMKKKLLSNHMSMEHGIKPKN